VVYVSDATSTGKGLRLAQPCTTLEVMHKSLAAEAAKDVVMDIHQEATAVVSLVREKRTKVVTMETIKAKPTGSQVHKSPRLKGAAASSTSMDKAKRLAAERNLDPVAGNDDFSILDLYSDSRLSSDITDSCIVIVPSAGSPVEALSILRAKEKVQAALIEVANRKEREMATCAAREAAPMSSPV
jgi:hypothetical protein